MSAKIVGQAPLSGSLHQVLDAFRDNQIKKDGSVDTYGNTLQRQANALKDNLDFDASKE